jgi:hypothetical protein
MTRIPRHFQLELKQGNNLGTTKGITDRTGEARGEGQGQADPAPAEPQAEERMDH